MPITAVLGEQRGDEGKGRFVDDLAQSHDIVARFNGGPNAGHQVRLPSGLDLALHVIPSGISHEHAMNVIGDGVVIDPYKLVGEIDEIRGKGIEVNAGRLLISSSAHLLLPHHVSDDEVREAGAGAQGSTKTGIAQVYSEKALRIGVRAELINNDIDKLGEHIASRLSEANEKRRAVGLDVIEIGRVTDEYIEAAMALGEYVTDTSLFLNRELKAGKRVLAEGAQAFLLDIDQGMYPAVTSSSTISGGVMTGLGVRPQYLERVVGVSKAVQSHVGGGPFATEILDEELADRLHGDMTQIDAEAGTTTGRKRRLGHLDLAVIKRAQDTNGTTEMALTKLDWVPRYGETVLVCTSYERKAKELEKSPNAAYKIEQSTANYEELPTWQEDVSGIRNFFDLPAAARGYIEFIEEQTELPITMIGVGPGREEVIYRN